MKELISFHLFPFGLCLWYILSYVLQPFRSGIIAAVLIVALAFISCRNPAKGAILGVFLTPLTLSLGRHLEAYLGANAPPYLPYAEIVLISILSGWILRALVEHYKAGVLAMVHRQRTEAENLVLGIMTLWAVLAVIGIYPALYRNIMTSPAMPLELVAIKAAFAPVWGWADEFFPITMALRILLAWCFVFYTQKLVASEGDVKRMAYAFCAAMALAVAYAVLQALAGIGFSRSGDPSYYIQSTFHENESFGSFCLVALVMVFLLNVFRTSDLAAGTLHLLGLNARGIVLWSLAGLFVLGIIISASRAIMILTVVILLSLFLYFSSSSERGSFLSRCLSKKNFIPLLLLIPLLFMIAFTVSERVPRKLRKLGRDVGTVFVTENGPHGVPSRNLTFYRRIRLWREGLNMLVDSRGAGMGTGSYYRLTGFPRYDAIGFRENAHFFWLQLVSEHGIASIPVVLGLFFVPFSLWRYAITRDGPGPRAWTHERGSRLQRSSICIFLLGGLCAFWFCNVVGQSLLQQEILWLFALFIGVSAIGALPQGLGSLGRSGFSRKVVMTGLCVLVVGQAGLWASTAGRTDFLGLPSDMSETYGFAYDDDGHRYLLVGRVYQDKVVVPSSGSVLQFRVAPAKQYVSESDPLRVTCFLFNQSYELVATGFIDIVSKHGPVTLTVPVNVPKGEYLNVRLDVQKVTWEGNFLRSEERRPLGLKYYGCRWAG